MLNVSKTYPGERFQVFLVFAAFQWLHCDSLLSVISSILGAKPSRDPLSASKSRKHASTSRCALSTFSKRLATPESEVIMALPKRSFGSMSFGLIWGLFCSNGTHWLYSCRNIALHSQDNTKSMHKASQETPQTADAKQQHYSFSRYPRT